MDGRLLQMTWTEFAQVQSRTQAVSHRLANSRSQYWFKSAARKREIVVSQDGEFPGCSAHHRTVSDCTPQLPRLRGRRPQRKIETDWLPLAPPAVVHFPQLPASKPSPRPPHPRSFAFLAS